MARIRSIKPDAFLSESLSSIPRGARWTFAGLWTYLDDEGRGRADARLIHAALYAIDDTTTIQDVADDLDDLEKLGAICRYEAGGRTYIHATGWHHQKINRPTPSRVPPCPIRHDLTDGSLNPHGETADPYVHGPPDALTSRDADSLSTHGGLTEETVLEQGTGNREKEQGTRNRDARETRDNPLSHPEPFNEFVDTWPGNVQVKRAFAYWPAAVKAAKGAQTILDAAHAYADWIRRSGTEPRYVRSAANWLRDEGWRDELKSATRTSASAPSTTDQRVTDAFKLAQQLREEQDPGHSPKAIGR
jgi:hypothetical protein